MTTASAAGPSSTSNRLDLLTGGAKDVAARQRTLREAINWSYELLDSGEQQLFRVDELGADFVRLSRGDTTLSVPFSAIDCVVKTWK